ncbi:hypothetical protein [Streptomyces sp. NPDC059828]|uniref:hypothetical protein n=1 Tax=Streptomyces sp. NPDC059828 TaxID=3346965 RepID=UPI003646F06A
MATGEAVLGAPSLADEADVRAALEEVYATDTRSWEPVHRVTVHDALPAMTARGNQGRLL